MKSFHSRAKNFHIEHFLALFALLILINFARNASAESGTIDHSSKSQTFKENFSTAKDYDFDKKSLFNNFKNLSDKISYDAYAGSSKTQRIDLIIAKSIDFEIIENYLENSSKSFKLGFSHLSLRFLVIF